MHAEFPPDFPLTRIIERVTFYEPVDCMMWRMGGHCPNVTEQGALCEDAQHRRFIVAQCPLCASDAPLGIQVPDNVIEHQITNQVLARFEFAPEYQDRIAMSDILGTLNKSGRADEMRVANALKAHGATKERTHEGARWNGLRWKI